MAVSGNYVGKIGTPNRLRYSQGHASDPARHCGGVPARAVPARSAVRAARPPGRVHVMAKIGYARVSTRSQKDDSQVDELTAYGCDKIFSTRRPESSLPAPPTITSGLRPNRNAR